MIQFNYINSADTGLIVRAILNDALRSLITGDEGINVVWRRLTEMTKSLKDSNTLLENSYAELREQILKSIDYTDTSVADLLTYINGMNGGVSGFAIDTSFVPNFPDGKAVTVIGAGAGTYIYMLDVDGNPITIDDEDAITIFYKGENSTYWQFKSVNARVVIDRVSNLNISKDSKGVRISGTDDSGNAITFIEIGGATKDSAGMMLPSDREVIEKVTPPTSTIGIMTLSDMQAYSPIGDETLDVGYLGTPVRYTIITTTSDGKTVNVGTLDCFSDITLSKYTQVFTTHHLLVNETFDELTCGEDTHIYVRSFNLVGTPNIWGPWVDILIDNPLSKRVDLLAGSLSSTIDRVTTLEKTTTYSVNDIFSEDYEGWKNRQETPVEEAKSIFGDYSDMQEALSGEICFEYWSEKVMVVTTATSSSQVLLFAHFREFTGEVWLTYSQGELTNCTTVYYATVRKSEINELQRQISSLPQAQLGKTIVNVNTIIDEDADGYENAVEFSGKTALELFGDRDYLLNSLNNGFVYLDYLGDISEVVSTFSASDNQIILRAFCGGYSIEIQIMYDNNGSPTKGSGIYHSGVTGSTLSTIRDNLKELDKQVDILSEKVDGLENSEIIWTDVQ